MQEIISARLRLSRVQRGIGRQLHCSCALISNNRGEPDAVSDQTLQAVLAAAVRIYAASRGGDVKPFADGSVTATEAIIAACGVVRAVDLSPFDVQMWFHRMPAH